MKKLAWLAAAVVAVAFGLVLGEGHPASGQQDPDLVISKQALGTPWQVGGQGSFTITVQNVGAFVVVTNEVFVTDTIPAGFTFTGFSGSGWMCTPSPPVSGPVTIICTNAFPFPPPTALPTLTLAVTVDQPPPVAGYVNCASVDWQIPGQPGQPAGIADANPADNTSCVTVQVSAPAHDLGIVKEALNQPWLVGSQGTFTVTVQNLGAAIPAGANIVVTDPIPAGLSFLGFTGTGWNCTPPPATTVICVFTGPVAAGATLPSLTFTVSIDQPPPAAGYQNCASVTWELPGAVADDVNPANDRSCTGIDVTSPTTCCLDMVFLAGTGDDFVGPEPSSPSAGLLAAYAGMPLVRFDEAVSDRHFLHTFVLPSGNTTQSATLEVRARPLGGLSTNDAIHLAFYDVNGLPAGPSQGYFFGSGNPSTLPVLLSPPALWQTQGATVFTIPLSAAMVASLDSLRYLDVVIKDDTTVDYVKLTVKFCGSTTTDRPITFPAPSLVDPPSGTLLTSLATTLRWQNPQGTTQYQIQVAPFNSDGPGINLIIGDPILVASARYQVMAPQTGVGNYLMLPGMTYSWRVRATNKATFAAEADPSWGPWSPTWTFCTPAPSSATIGPVFPANGATVASTTPLALQWSNTATDIFYYEVQASSDPNFGSQGAVAAVWHNLVHGGVTSPLNSWLTPQLQPSTTYYWRVRPRVQGDGAPVAWSATWSFRTP